MDGNVRRLITYALVYLMGHPNTRPEATRAMLCYAEKEVSQLDQYDDFQSFYNPSKYYSTMLLSIEDSPFAP